ncbi:unnamed protein product [Clonostachys solani]|uniref:Zn(2)-C6 fungal-type domain-containing protein n=1 Tax=Clonostachys solani TaxID=160281 RepID=A0A9N9Z0M9_9HYPO|nr:unnamed protein product [Clonostachys solani]
MHYNLEPTLSSRDRNKPSSDLPPTPPTSAISAVLPPQPDFLRSREMPPRCVTRACINCQRRKSRCVRSVGRGRTGDGAPCSYCAQTGKSCSFENPPDRTPLTRNNLDAAELRCAQLRSLIKSLNPDLDIDSAIGQQAHTPSSSQAIEAAWDASTLHEYEWHEDSLSPEAEHHRLAGSDGMATISNNDSGYLGPLYLDTAVIDNHPLGSSSGSYLLGEIDPDITLRPQAGRRRAQRMTDPSQRAPWLDGPEPLDLPLSYAASQLIDAFFIRYNTSYPILHEKAFRDRVVARPVRLLPHSPWRVIYYMVLAIGHWATSDETEHLRARYYTAARASFSFQMLESGTTETVQAFLLVGNYLQKRDRANTGYNFIGLAYRMAVGLGMHHDPPTSDSNTVGHERRRQIFWTAYCFESGFNITTGRPPAISETFFDTKLPLNIDDHDLSLQSPVPQELNYPTTCSAIIAQARLAKIGDAIYREFLLARTNGSKIEYRLAESLNRELTGWKQSLPPFFEDPPSSTPWFQGPRAVVLWKEQNLRILLWRGSQDPPAFLTTRVTANERCMDATLETIHDIAGFCMLGDITMYQSLAWYATYFIFQAALVLEACPLQNSAHDPGQMMVQTQLWQHSTMEVRSCLRKLSETSKSAERCLELLDQVQTRFRPVIRNGFEAGESREGVSNHQLELVPEIPVDVQVANDPATYNPDQQQELGNELTDPSLRGFLDEMSLDYMDNLPLDFLFGEWPA